MNQDSISAKNAHLDGGGLYRQSREMGVATTRENQRFRASGKQFYNENSQKISGSVIM